MNKTRLITVLCTGLTIVAVPTCTAAPADLYEPNNSFNEAFFLGGIMDFAQVDIAISPTWDEDVYLFQAADYGELRIELDFAHADGDLDMVLYTFDQNGVVNANSSDDNERITYAVDAYAFYFLVIKGYQGATNEYDLRFYGPDLIPDAFSGNDSHLNPAFLGRLGSGTISNLTVEAGIQDWYNFTPASDGVLQIDIAFGHETGDLDLSLINDQGGELIGSASGNDNEGISYYVHRGSNYFIKVYGNHGSHDENIYKMYLVGPDPLPDRYENNPTRLQAATVGWTYDNGQTNLTLHTDTDEDWYRVKATFNGTATVYLFHDMFTHAPTINLYDSTGFHLATSSRFDQNGFSATELLSHPIFSKQIYYIQVSEPDGNTCSYDLRVHGPSLYEEPYEPNNTIAEAQQHEITGGIDAPGYSLSTPGDLDIFHVKPLGTGTMLIRVGFEHAFGNIDLLVSDENDNPLFFSVSHTDHEALDIPVSTLNSTFFVKIYSPDHVVQQYSLEIVNPWAYPRPATEPNDSFAQAADLGPAGQITHPSSIYTGYDVDYFRLTAADAGVISVDLTFASPPGGPLLLEAFREDQSSIGRGTPVVGGEYINIGAQHPGQVFFLRVNGLDEATNEYLLTIQGPAGPGSSWQALQPSGQRIVLKGQGESGKTYTLQQATNLWHGFDTILRTGVPGNTLMMHTIEVDRAVSPMFFRLLEESAP